MGGPPVRARQIAPEFPLLASRGGDGDDAMTFPAVSPDEMRAGQMLTGFAMTAFIAAAFFPRHAGRIRAMTLALYLTGIAAFVIWFLVR